MESISHALLPQGSSRRNARAPRRLLNGVAAGLAGLLLLASGATPAGANEPFVFSMVVSAGAASCVPNASGRVKITAGEQFDTMNVQVTGLPPNTEFDFFVIQVPTAPFGLSWYQGDINSDGAGHGNATFAGVFSRETFIVAPGVASAPTTFPNGPFPDANMNPATPPVQLYHLGLWFSSPRGAGRAGCPTTVTPFSGNHRAGIQVLNTNNFPALAGPLLGVN